MFFPLYEVLRIVRIIETKSRTVTARGWGSGEWGIVIQWMEFQFCKMKRILEMDGGDDYAMV